MRAVAFAAAALAGSAHAGHCNYGFPAGTPTFTDITAEFLWTNHPQGNVFGSMQWWFEEGQGGYMGSQFHTSGDQSVLFSVWDVSAALPNTSLPAGPNCHRFGGEGLGSHCMISVKLEVGTRYTVQMYRDGDVDGGVHWSGRLINNRTQAVTKIGTLLLKDSKGYKGYGNLKPQGASFIEYYTGGSFYSAYGWQGPFGNNKSHHVVSAHSDQETNVAVSADCPGLGSGAPTTYYQEGPNITTTAAKTLWGSGTASLPQQRFFADVRPL